MTSQGSARSASYRRDIDGLRCIAVGSVILFHAMPGYAPAGFFGVDIFFVISGYLITGIILREVNEGRFSILEFYKRRVRRIFPALILLLCSMLVLGWFLFVDHRYERLGLHSAAAAGFVANILFWKESSYFISSSDLLHLWSLGVEEQFYLAWPLLLFMVTCRRRPILPSLFIVAVLSFGYSVYATINDPTAAFYSPASRFWQLSIGGIVAALPDTRRPTSVATVLGMLGAAFIAAPILLLDKNALLPGFWALLPVLGAAAIIHAGRVGLVNRLLSLKPAVWIGLISYPLYLGHWPALQMVTSFTPSGDRDLYVKLAVVASVALAAMTYRFVELPMRRKNPVLLLASMGVVFVTSIGVYARDGVPGRAIDRNGKRVFVEHYAQVAEAGDPNSLRAECDFLAWHQLKPLDAISESCVRQGPAGTRLLWGDSHAQALSPGLRSEMPQGVSLAQVATSGCHPAIPVERKAFENNGPFARACRRSNGFALATIARLRPQVVYLVQSGHHEDTDWDELAGEIQRRGAGDVLLIGPVPQWQPSLPLRLADHWPQFPLTLGGVDPAIFATDKVLSGSKFRNLRYVSLVRRLCDGVNCMSRVGNIPVVVDYGHLSSAGALFVAQSIRDELQPKMAGASSASEH